MKALWFDLTRSEMHISSIVGVQRALDAVRNQRSGRYGAEEGAGFDYNIFGCCGELALAKHLNCFWNGAFGDLSAADVGDRHQVRASDYTGPNAGLILHQPDHDDQRFVKAVVRLPRVWLMGWLFARDGKQDHFWTDKLRPGRPCFLVPHDQLHPMETFGDPR